MKLSRLLAVTLYGVFTSALAHAAPENLIAHADGDLTLNRSAAIVAQAMVPVLPQLGDSGLAVKTNLTIDREASVLTLSVKPDERGHDKTPATARELTCDVFSVTAESTNLFVSKARATEDLSSGSRRDTTIRGECKDQSGRAANVVVSFDRDSYSVLINDSLKSTSPRFDVVIGPLPKKK